MAKFSFKPIEKLPEKEKPINAKVAEQQREYDELISKITPDQGLIIECETKEEARSVLRRISGAARRMNRVVKTYNAGGLTVVARLPTEEEMVPPTPRRRRMEKVEV